MHVRAPCAEGHPSEKIGTCKKVEVSWRPRPLDLASSGVWFQDSLFRLACLAWQIGVGIKRTENLNTIVIDKHSVACDESYQG